MDREKYFVIVPMNEGQDMNYIEYNYQRLPLAIARASEMNKKLRDALPQAAISVRVEDASGKKLEEVM